MSSNNSSFTDAIRLGVSTAVAVNMAHPLYNLKNAIALSQRVFPQSCVGFSHRFTHMYRGIGPILISDLFQCPLIFVIDRWLQDRQMHAVPSAIISGGISAVPIAIAEDVAFFQSSSQIPLKMALQEYYRRRLLLSAIPGIAATALREIPYGFGILAMPKYVDKVLPEWDKGYKDAVAGFVSGVLMGASSAPLDMAKSRIQANRVSFLNGYRSVWNEMRAGGALTKLVLRFTVARTIHIAAAMTITNCVKAEYGERFNRPPD
jgi:hypothetical protein